jgi:hypothetical protein
MTEGIAMNSLDFNNCRAFLEHMIQQQPQINELIQAYVKLIEKKTEFDIASSGHYAEVQKNWENSQKEMTINWHKTQAEITKASIEKAR